MENQLSPNYISIQSSELVFLQNELAGIGSRALAYLLDLAVRFLLVVIVLYVSSPLQSQPRDYLFFLSFVLLFIYSGYHIVLEWLLAGKTPGKYAAGVRVIRENGSPISLLDAVIRNVLRAVDMLPAGYFAAFLVMFLESRTRRIGDILAGTIVVYDRPRHRDLRAFVDSQLLTVKPSRDIAIGGLHRLTDTERAVIRDLYDRIHKLEMQEKARLLSKFSEKIVGKLTVTGTEDPETILYELYKRL